jgi:hypothetical protein
MGTIRRTESNARIDNAPDSSYNCPSTGNDKSRIEAHSVSGSLEYMREGFERTSDIYEKVRNKGIICLLAYEMSNLRQNEWKQDTSDEPFVTRSSRLMNKSCSVLEHTAVFP